MSPLENITSMPANSMSNRQCIIEEVAEGKMLCSGKDNEEHALQQSRGVVCCPVTIKGGVGAKLDVCRHIGHEQKRQGPASTCACGTEMSQWRPAVVVETSQRDDAVFEEPEDFYRVRGPPLETRPPAIGLGIYIDDHHQQQQGETWKSTSTAAHWSEMKSTYTQNPAALPPGNPSEEHREPLLQAIESIPLPCDGHQDEGGAILEERRVTL